MIPGSDANALSANLSNNCDRAFNLFFIHSLAPPFLSLVVVLCDVGVDVVLGPPNRGNDSYTLFLKKGPYSLTKSPSFFIQELHD